MKRITAILLTIVLLLATAVPTLAAAPNVAIPYYANTSQASVTLVIDETGSASWTIMCLGKSSCTGIESRTYLERQVGDSWVRVDLGNATNEFTYSTSASRMVKTYEMDLSTHGTYRATVIFTVYGTAEDETLTYWATRTF